MSVIAVIGGTGQLGKGIARRLAKAGHQITIGSRTAEKAVRTALEIGYNTAGASNDEAAIGRDIVIVAVPYANQKATLEQLKDEVGKAIVVDTTVPLVPLKVMRVELPSAGSAAAEARDYLGPDIRFVTAFHNVAAHALDSDENVDCDVLVFSDDVEARTAIIELIFDRDLRALAGGSLANSAAAEAMTSLLIFMNKTYKAEGAGIRFTGLTTAPPVA